MDEDAFTPRTHSVVSSRANEPDVICRITLGRVNTIQAGRVRALPPIFGCATFRDVKPDAGDGASSGLRVKHRKYLVERDRAFNATSCRAGLGEVGALFEDAPNHQTARDGLGRLIAWSTIGKVLHKRSRFGFIVGFQRQSAPSPVEGDVSGVAITVQDKLGLVFSGHVKVKHGLNKKASTFNNLRPKKHSRVKGVRER